MVISLLAERMISPLVVLIAELATHVCPTLMLPAYIFTLPAVLIVPHTETAPELPLATVLLVRLSRSVVLLTI